MGQRIQTNRKQVTEVGWIGSKVREELALFRSSLWFKASAQVVYLLQEADKRKGSYKEQSKEITELMYDN
jgi:hypothetical protein